MDDLYLDNIDEFVNDQNKIVTYKWLSLTLGVHVNTAKQMLYHYLEQKRKESSKTPLHATYLISGKCSENGSMCHKVSVVREDKLEDVKAKMDVTISVHVYSLQRAELKDSAPLYSTDYDAVKENLKNCSKYSAIRCAAAVPLSSAVLQRAQDLTPPAQKEISKPGLSENSSATSKPSTKQASGIMGMFASKNAARSQESSKEVKTEQKDDSSLVETSNKQPSSKANPMSNFFGKSAQKKSDEKPNKSIKEEIDVGSTTSTTVSMKQSQPSPKPECGIKEEQPKVSNSLKEETQDSCNKTKRSEPLDSEDEKMESQQKKRRRIKKPQADSSDDDDVVPDSPPPVPNVHTPSPEDQVKREPHQEESSEVKRRKRRRVLKSRTFVDEEGSFVTEKGYVSESYSESEESEPNSQAKDTSSLKQSFGKREDEKKEKRQKKTTVANKTTKQPSIMGFFQKK
ncbi:DNA polymerase delta subunit 3 isoform X1 [Xyrauchen texanus]|uniref:DNA polymerase delta subunit 3 isoform X1 n=1 Tax=Xyrauchen texanus TaxID=154827 RepID=UPI002241DD5B|nr:DNA polymerase delta subunit 3 isoform X1 [Xyrauchen texanus]